ncbi:carboxylating nicotinate-nucleotide diphosphorylase [Miltoncostaea marina]|uniref:carboxylating nicotinate-nucleotide diphosphorylase n=1 Tax=Miltoncostaea marina TaxID=2843215 RepID=UPI001C3E80F1|nr:carboxylating nicotinate-nucleotide diphosphorylase [Miltoncostaea marina]
MSAREVVARALAEDLGERGDITSELLVPADARAVAWVVARRAGVLAGRAAGEEVLRQTGVDGDWRLDDGDRLEPGSVVAEVSGPARAVLAAERTLLNLLCRLSGIATLTAEYVAACGDVAVLDTRKTTPGLRALEKAAVRAGGGVNHRMGLHDRVLVKDNHLALAGAGLADAVARARREMPDVVVEVEADDLDGVRHAIEAGADWVLLDNMTPGELRAAVALAAGRAKLEASGGMTLEGARAAAAAGVDAVSVGALTHSAAALDLGLDIEA